MKKIDENQLWKKIQRSLPDLPYLIEVPLSFLEAILWPQSSENELKYKGKLLAYILRKHGCIVTKRNGKRYAVFPKSILSTREIKKKGEKKEANKVLAESVWPW